MSSTKNEKELRRFFEKKLVPAAEKLRARGVELFPTAADDAESWYVPGPIGEPEFFEFEPGDVERTLREMWERDGLPELAKLAPDLAKLTRRLEFTEEESEDVSPFVYAMW